MQAGAKNRAVTGTTSVRPSSGVRLQVVEGVLDPLLLAAWDELALATAAPPWVRPGWLLPWWDSMSRGLPLVFVLRSAKGELSAVLPLQRTRRGLSSPTNWHTPEFAVVAQDASARDEILLRVFGRCATRLTFDFVMPELADALSVVADARGGRSHRRVLESSPYVPLQEDWESRVDKHLLAEVRRRGRRLAERGRVDFDVSDGSQDVESRLEEGLRVEASGWKGRAGTAMVSAPETLSFYRRVTKWAAEEGLLRLAFQRLDGRPIAFDLAVEHGGAHYLLKTGYDEELRTLAPGKQLRLHMLRDCTVRGLQSYELLGDAQLWKREWTPLRRERLQAHAFAPGPAGAPGWLLHGKALPAARTVRDALAGARRDMGSRGRGGRTDG